jgi:hypothetical protein
VVKSTGLEAKISLLHLPHLGLSFSRSDGTLFTAPQYGHTTFLEKLIISSLPSTGKIPDCILDTANISRDQNTGNQVPKKEVLLF